MARRRFEAALATRSFGFSHRCDRAAGKRPDRKGPGIANLLERKYA